jgi:hypothetical protein
MGQGWIVLIPVQWSLWAECERLGRGVEIEEVQIEGVVVDFGEGSW